MSYQSPIEVFYNDIEYRFEDAVFKAIQKVDIKADRNEIIKALEYDRGQYEKGYADGKADAQQHGRWEIVYYDNVPTLAYCDQCDQILQFTRKTEVAPNYCPNCGAKMDL